MALFEFIAVSFLYVNGEVTKSPSLRCSKFILLGREIPVTGSGRSLGMVRRVYFFPVRWVASGLGGEAAWRAEPYVRARFPQFIVELMVTMIPWSTYGLL